MPQPMTPARWRAFVTTGTRTAVLGTTRRDGRPHAAPVGIVLDGDDILFVTRQESVKARNLRHDPQVTLVVDDAVPPYSFVLVEGVAEVSPALDEIRRAAYDIGVRYHGAEAAAGFVEQVGVPGTVLVRVRPTRVVAVDGVAG